MVDRPKRPSNVITEQQAALLRKKRQRIVFANSEVARRIPCEVQERGRTKGTVLRYVKHDDAGRSSMDIYDRAAEQEAFPRK